tara:strand:+ start:13038 stop:14222 length:1185 start_codon:yes stop_codon:yes gene_type:complete
MADETYRPRKIVPTPDFEGNWEEEVPTKGTPVPQKKNRPSGKEMLADVQAVRAQAAAERGEEPPTPPIEGLEISGNMPPQMQTEMTMARSERGSAMSPTTRGKKEEGGKKNRGRKKPLAMQEQQNLSVNEGVKEILKRVQPFVDLNYDEITLPSMGRFYDGEDGPTDGILHVRPMTGQEEQILATPRWVKGGKAMDMIFEKCLQEDYSPINLLSIDRTYLLIFLRGISYTPEYEVEIKCPDCSTKYSSVIHLNELPIDECSDNFGPEKLDDVLPTTGFAFGYRLSTGFDENEVSKHRERKAKWFGDRTTDDTLLFRMASLIEYIEDITHKKDIQTVLEKLPVSDVNYIRNVVNEPPFGVDTKIPQVCVSCMSEFDIDLPLEANFFFPRRVREED